MNCCIQSTLVDKLPTMVIFGNRMYWVPTYNRGYTFRRGMKTLWKPTWSRWGIGTKVQVVCNVAGLAFTWVIVSNAGFRLPTIAAGVIATAIYICMYISAINHFPEY